MIIKVPKTPKSAFDKNRPASSLLQAQIEHLEAAVGRYEPPKRHGRKRVKRRTEGEAAAYIAELTRQLRRQPDAPPDVAVKPAGATAAAPPSGKRRSQRKRTRAPKRLRR